VLIIDDHEATRVTLRRLFNLNGWDVKTAGTLSEGLAALTSPPECVVLDLGLPDGRGEAILEKVRMEKLPTRVIVVTALFDPPRLAHVVRLRPEGLLMKPISPDVLERLCVGELGSGG
jgi:two-component system KDP operon response regulator KdpE